MKINIFTLRHKKLPRTKMQRGFVLLLASLIASLLASLGLAMTTIAQKQLLLSSMGKESQYAFYAADTGAECATYLDFNLNAFATSTIYTTPVSCAGSTLKESPTHADLNSLGLGGTSRTTFQFEANGRCVEVAVTKKTQQPFTTIESLGYNTSCSDTTNPRRLERAVRAVF